MTATIDRLSSIHAKMQSILEAAPPDSPESKMAITLFAMAMCSAWPGLRRICDAYVESETELRYLKKEFWQKDDWETAKQEAEARLEEMLR
jgi:hypothetical protein